MPCQVLSNLPSIDVYDHYSKMLSKRNIQCEPVKNLLVHMHFLTQHSQEGDTVVIASSGDCLDIKHLPKLVALFPQLKWCIYGHSASSMEGGKFKYNASVMFPQLLFDDNMAKEWLPRKDTTLLISQVKYNAPVVVENQKKWVEIMQPKAACLKVKPSFSFSEDTENEEKDGLDYFDGRMYMQPFAAPNSIEMCLFVGADRKTKKYSYKHMEGAAAFFNRMIRPRHDFDVKCMESIVKEYNAKYETAPIDVQIVKDFLAACIRKQQASKCG